MLAGGLFSLIVAVIMLLGETVLGYGSGSYLLIGLVVIGMSAGGAIWLKSIARAEAAT